MKVLLLTISAIFFSSAAFARTAVLCTEIEEQEDERSRLLFNIHLPSNQVVDAIYRDGMSRPPVRMPECYSMSDNHECFSRVSHRARLWTTPLADGGTILTATFHNPRNENKTQYFVCAMVQ